MRAYLTPTGLFGIAVAVLIGAAGGYFALIIGAPMPWLLGAFIASGAVNLVNLTIAGVKPVLPMPIRNLFVAVIGVMIGGSFHPGILSSFSQIWIPALAVLIFVLVALAMNYALFRRIGGYDPTTAFFAAMPGGLIESIAMGEKAGADTHILALQQFSRISLVITSLPFIFLIWTGEKVGSAAGVTLTGQSVSAALDDWLILAACAVLGLIGGRALRLPASILIGPLILSAIAHSQGLTEAGPPVWLVAVAQVFVGTGLGARFRGFAASEFTKVILLAVLSVTCMLILDVVIVLGLRLFVDIPFEVLVISFAPGGVTETALIALSLHANPVFVTSLHLLRIILTVIISSAGFRILSRKHG